MNSPATSVTRLRVHISPVVGWFVLWRENYHRAILDFYNNIGTKRTCRHAATMSALGAKPDDICSLRAFEQSSGACIGPVYRPWSLTARWKHGMMVHCMNDPQPEG